LVAHSREIRELRVAGLLEGCHVHAIQLALRRLERSYDGFFRRCAQDARREGFPRFKAARRWRSFGFKELHTGERIENIRPLHRATSPVHPRAAGVGAKAARLAQAPQAGGLGRSLLI